MYVTSRDYRGDGSIAVYPAAASGRARPVSVISGPDTGLATPSSIALGTSGKIYVANQGPPTCTCGFCYTNGPGSITVYPAGAGGGAQPIATISGPNTGLGIAHAIAVDSEENIYVLAYPDTSLQFVCTPGFASFAFAAGQDRILVFSAGSKGDTPPAAVIGGPFSALYSPSGIAVGATGP